MVKHAHRHTERAAREHGTVTPERGATTDRQTPPRTGVQRLLRARVVLPVLAALGFGCYTIWMAHTSGASGGRAALLGLIAAVVSGALGLLLVHFQSSMITETRALAYGALFGTAMGWLYNLSGPSILKSSVWGLVMGAVMFAASLYVFRTHRVREPHGLHRPRTVRHTRGTHRPHGAH